MFPQIHVLLRSPRSTSLELLHLRQSRVDLNINVSEFFERVTEQEGSSSDQGGSGDQSSESYRLRTPLRHLAQWAFGPDGIPSLKFIACGDYAYGGRSSGSERVDVILCRPKAGSKKAFRILDRFDDRAKEERTSIIDVYRDFLEACPVEPLLVWE